MYACADYVWDVFVMVLGGEAKKGSREDTAKRSETIRNSGRSEVVDGLISK